MKIYQLHERSGVWEDYRDYIIGTYLRKERAEEEKAKAEAKEKELIKNSEKCNACPFLDCAFIDNKLLEKYLDYCSEVSLEESEYGVDCVNYYTHWDKADFHICEVEVEE